MWKITSSVAYLSTHWVCGADFDFEIAALSRFRVLFKSRDRMGSSQILTFNSLTVLTVWYQTHQVYIKRAQI